MRTVHVFPGTLEMPVSNLAQPDRPLLDREFHEIHVTCPDGFDDTLRFPVNATRLYEYREKTNEEAMPLHSYRVQDTGSRARILNV